MNSKIDWKKKLTSRKFWIAVAGFVSGLLVAIGMPEAQAAQVGGLILSGASVISYIIGEGMTDAANAANAQDYIAFADDEVKTLIESLMSKQTGE